MRRLFGPFEWLFKPWDPAIVRSLMVLSFVLVAGTAGYSWIEGWDPWKAFFFTLVTVTTVGYGDYGLSHAGERFTALVMIGGIGTASYAISQLLRSAVARTLRPEKRMLQRAKQLKDHHIICGYGRMGQRIAARLRDEDAPFVIIDHENERLTQARADGHIALEGDATEDLVLMRAGLLKASTIAAITSSDAINALICLTANAIQPDVMIIARAEQDSSICKLRRAGAVHVLSPSAHGADHVAQHLLRPEVARVLFGEDSDGVCEHGGLAFSEVVVDGESGFAGKTVSEIGQAHPRVVFVASCAPDGDLSLRPEPSHALEKGEVLVIAGIHGDLEALRNGRRAAA